MREFTLRIKMGNEAMQTPEDVADVLREAANDVLFMDYDAILDMNGNKVGDWRFKA